MLTSPILVAATSHGLDPVLVACLVWQESKGDAKASRVELRFYERYLKGKQPAQLAGVCPCYEKDEAFSVHPSIETELVHRATSWGVAQVLGETARSLGFKNTWLTDLQDIELGLEYGCRYLRQCFARAAQMQVPKRTLEEQALVLYNGAEAYARKVLAHRASGIYGRIF